MISEAYELFGCNTADIFILSVNYGDSDAECIAFDQTYGIEFPCISGIEGGGTAINSTYGINLYPTYILIAPNHDIVEQDMWPIPNVGTFINYFESNGVQQSACGSVMMVDFTADVTNICEMDVVHFIDESTGNITSWNWTFEGGFPATSDVQNPVVTYFNEGTYDVSLTVSSGGPTQTLLIANYITVLPAPPVMLLPFSDVCVGWPAFMLTGGSPSGGTYTGPGVAEGWFDPTAAGLGTHQITYTYVGENGCDNSAVQSILVDPCTGINELNGEPFSIYPNPTTGSFEVKLIETGAVTISVMNLLGEEVYRHESFASGAFTQTIKMDNNESGIYFVRVQLEAGTYVKKLKLLD